MRHAPRLTPFLALGAALMLSACGSRTVQPPPTPLEITISLTGGQVTVTPEDANVRRNQVVRWVSANPDAVWVVVFQGGSPMLNGQRVFNGGGPGQSNQGPISGSAPSTEYKYWVFFPNNGQYVQVDPKLIVIN